MATWLLQRGSTGIPSDMPHAASDGCDVDLMDFAGAPSPRLDPKLGAYGLSCSRQHSLSDLYFLLSLLGTGFVKTMIKDGGSDHASAPQPNPRYVSAGHRKLRMVASFEYSSKI